MVSMDIKARCNIVFNEMYYLLKKGINMETQKNNIKQLNIYYTIYSRKSKFTRKRESIENKIELCKNNLKNKYNINEEDFISYFLHKTPMMN